MAAIAFRGVSLRYGGQIPALSAVDLEIDAGDLAVVLGPSGSGKTTLLRLLAGLEAPDAGEVWIDGQNMTRVPPDRRDVAMVFQNPALYPHLSVFDNLAFGLRARGVARDQVRSRVDAIADLLGVGALLRRWPASLSGGERQRVALGRAVVREPRVLLCDEPFSSLDPPLRATLREEVAELHRRFGSTFVLVTHDQAEALLLGDRIAVLERGRLLQCGAPADVYRRPVDRFVASFVGSPPMNLLRCEVGREDDRIRVRLTGPQPDSGWSMPAELGPAEWPESGAVELGIRPESICIVDDGGSARAPGSPVLAASVRRLEFLGHEQLVWLAVGPQQVVTRVPAARILRVGQDLHIGLALNEACWFDPTTGRALARG